MACEHGVVGPCAECGLIYAQQVLTLTADLAEARRELEHAETKLRVALRVLKGHKNALAAAEADAAQFAEKMLRGDGGAWVTCLCCGGYAHQVIQIKHRTECRAAKYLAHYDAAKRGEGE